MGANIAISPIDQMSTASSGCCIGHASGVGTLPPNRLRHVAATALFAAAFIALLLVTAVIAARALIRIAVPARLREAE